ncbi:glycosyltransferase family 4 protein [Vibrio fluvialis]|nr:glycosyltransferase family 4 protein [Vibrio fluvialis]
MDNLVYLCSSLKKTGPTNQLLNIVKTIKSQGFNPVVITLSPIPKDNRESDFVHAGVTVINLESNKWLGFFSIKGKLDSAIRKLNPVAIHSQGIRPDLYSLWSQTQSMKIATLRNIPQKDYVMTYGKVTGNLMTYIHTKVLKQLNYTIGVSEEVTNNLIMNFGFSSSKALTIKNSVDTSKFYRVSEAEKLEIRSKLGIPQKHIVWISVGHLSERKDPLNVVNSFNKADLGSNHLLILLGEGNLRKDLDKIGSPNIQLLGKVDSVHEYLKAADFFVSASHAEGLPNSVLEALSCGLPCVLSDIGPHKELSQNGIHGLHFKVGNAFEDSLIEVSRLDYRELSDNCLKIIDKEFSLDKMVGRYRKIYEAD